MTDAFRDDFIAPGPRWIIWTERVFSAIGWIFKYGGLMASGAALLWGGYMQGMVTGRDDGFNDGCQIGVSQHRCAEAASLGRAIRQASGPSPPGYAKNAEQEQTRMRLCRELSEGEHGQAFADHYACR